MIKKFELSGKDLFDVVISVFLIVLFFATAIIRGIIALLESLEMIPSSLNTEFALYMVYLITLLCTVYIVLKRRSIEAVILTSIWIIIVCIQLLIYPLNRELIFQNLPMIIMGPYSYLLVRSIKSPKIFLMCLCYMVFSLSIGGILAYIFFLRSMSYSMNYSYLMAFASIFYIVLNFESNIFRKNSRVCFLVLSVVLSAIVLLNGSRGAFLAICVCIMLIIFRRLQGKVLIIALILLPISYYIMFCILPFILNYLVKQGINSRTLRLLFSGEISSLLYMARRNILYEKIFLIILQHPLFGVGMLGDRLQLSIYSHNFFLEIIAQYGIFIGGVISCIVTVTCFKGILRKNEKNDWTVLCIIFVSFEFTKIMISTSYLVDIVFWIMLGIAVSTNRCKT